MNQKEVEDQAQIQKQKFVPSKILYMKNNEKNQFNYSKILKGRVNQKNIPKMFGNYFYKYLLRICKHRIKSLPLEQKSSSTKGNRIINLTTISKTSSKSVMIINQKKNFQNFLERSLIIDLIHSNKVESPSAFIGFIVFYQSISKEPEQFNCNRITNY